MGQRLRDRRVELGWSLRNLEDRTGVNNAIIHRIESGQIENPSLDKLQRIATALDVSLFQYLVEDHQMDLPDLRTYLTLRYPEIDDQATGKLARQLSATLRRVGIHAGEET